MSEQRPAPTIHFDEVYETYEGEVDPEAVISFARATNDAMPAYLEGRAVPPLYSAVLVLPSLNENMVRAVDNGAISGQTNGLRGIHAEHDVYFHAPLKPGQKLRWDARVRTVTVNKAGAMVTQSMQVRDLDDTLLVEHLWSSMALKSTTDAVGGPPLPDHRYPESARDHIIGTETFFLPKEQGRIYYEAAGDPAGHSLDEEIAKAEGYPGVILQGMCSLATAVGAVMRIAGDGNPDHLRRLAVRFSAPVVLGQELLVEVADVGTTENGTHVVVFEARQGDTVCLGHGRAEFRSHD